MVFRQGLSRGNRHRKVRVRDRTALLTAAIGGIFNSSGDLFAVFGVADFAHINETLN
jgi:hypothetical protein